MKNFLGPVTVASDMSVHDVTLIYAKACELACHDDSYEALRQMVYTGLTSVDFSNLLPIFLQVEQLYAAHVLSLSEQKMDIVCGDLYSAGLKLSIMIEEQYDFANPVRRDIFHVFYDIIGAYLNFIDAHFGIVFPDDVCDCIRQLESTVSSEFRVFIKKKDCHE